MPHPEREHSLQIEVARLQRELAIEREDRAAWLARHQEALAAARRECEGLRKSLRDSLNAAHHHVQAGQHWICSEPFACEEDCPCAALAAPAAAAGEEGTR